jgi:2,4'-dihydroxyacetophenone dioxygenase
MPSSTARSTRPPSSTPVDTAELEWIPLSDGLSFKPLRFFPDDTGYQLLLRVEPGTVIPRHRHTGEIHAFNLSGTRLLIDTGETIGPGMYVYEPVGNNDTWKATGTEPCIIHIEANGRVEYVDDDGQVIRHTDAATARAAYVRWCEKTGREPHLASQ